LLRFFRPSWYPIHPSSYIYIYSPCPLKGFDIGGFDPEETGRIICYGIISFSLVSEDDTWKSSIFLNAEFAVLKLQVIIYKSHQGRRHEYHIRLRRKVRTFPWPMPKNATCFCWRSLSRGYCTNITSRRVWEIMARGDQQMKEDVMWLEQVLKEKGRESRRSLHKLFSY
jgi:hypothetical protein